MNSIYRQGKQSGVAAIALTMLAAVVLLAGIAIPAQAQTYTALYNFSGAQWQADPVGPLALGRDGNFYGMSMGGAAPTFYEITPEGAYTELWLGNGIGWQCTAGFAVGPDGLLYGACWQINWLEDNTGAIIKLDPSQPGNGPTVFYKFPSYGCSVTPNSLTLYTDGNFYGTTQGSNCGSAGYGTFFKMTPSGTLTTLHTFQGTYGNDAAYPSAVTLGSDGNFYGTSVAGGIQAQNLNSGTVFKITPKGKVTLLYVFNGNNNGPDEPAAAPIQGANGKWYGTTWEGGTNGYGTIFQLAGKKINILHNFNMNVDNAGYPAFPLTLATDGNFYSASPTVAFGGYGPESLFEITTAKKPVYNDLFNWMVPGQGCNNQLTNGCLPGSPLALHPNGTFYGTTQGGGYPADSGVFYSFDMGLKPYIILQFPLGKKGTSIGIFGVGLTGTTAVDFNGVAATFNVVSDTYLTATIPTGATTGYVTVATPSGTLKSAVKLTVK